MAATIITKWSTVADLPFRFHNDTFKSVIRHSEIIGNYYTLYYTVYLVYSKIKHLYHDLSPSSAMPFATTRWSPAPHKKTAWKPPQNIRLMIDIICRYLEPFILFMTVLNRVYSSSIFTIAGYQSLNCNDDRPISMPIYRLIP